jgi:hypothetical protein
MSTVNPASTSGVAGPRSSGARDTETERSSAASLLRLIWGIHISRCAYAAAELGIAGLPADGAVSTRQLGQRTGQPKIPVPVANGTGQNGQPPQASPERAEADALSGRPAGAVHDRGELAARRPLPAHSRN